MSLPLTILALVCCVSVARSCSGDSCRLPHCSCATSGEHDVIPRSEVPQMVMFTFDDALNERVYEFYQSLFPKSLKNPNGCPISVTFFVSHKWTNYTKVGLLYRAGHEIGSHSVTHRMPQSWWERASYEDLRAEMEGQRNQLSQFADIPLSEIRGLRIPFLDTAGDVQMRMMADVGFQYDATFMTSVRAWPFTLDYPPTQLYCRNANCPQEAHCGMWEVPLNTLTTVDGEKCIMLDGCSQEYTDKADALEYLWHNFNKSRNGNGEPYGVNMHAGWFKVRHQLEAMRSFIAALVQLDDVYIVSVHQALEWMRSPCRLQDAARFVPWRTSCRPPGRYESVTTDDRNGSTSTAGEAGGTGAESGSRGENRPWNRCRSTARSLSARGMMVAGLCVIACIRAFDRLHPGV